MNGGRGGVRARGGQAWRAPSPSSQGTALRGRTHGAGLRGKREGVQLCAGRCGPVRAAHVAPPGRACPGTGGQAPSSGPSDSSVRRKGAGKLTLKGLERGTKPRAEVKGREWAQGGEWRRSRRCGLPWAPPPEQRSAADTDPCPVPLGLHQASPCPGGSGVCHMTRGRGAWAGFL